MSHGTDAPLEETNEQAAEARRGETRREETHSECQSSRQARNLTLIGMGGIGSGRTITPCGPRGGVVCVGKQRGIVTLNGDCGTAPTVGCG